MNRRSSPRSRCGPRRVVGVISNDGVVAADDAILGVVVSVVVSGVSGVRGVRAFASDWGRDGEAGLRCASRLLPTTQRDEFVEESRAWLLDLRDAGQPWYRLFGEWASILVRVPWLALIYRASRPRRAGR
jgi:hypothetical protein